MATRPDVGVSSRRGEVSFRVSVMTSVPLIEPTRPDIDIEDGRGGAKGILFGLLLCEPFWVGVYALLF
jgi:hypothetical protein